jgi:prepilin-type N-terminal cleavage/methylation domain-containing protein
MSPGRPLQRRGFTLVELLVVTAIIGVLVSLLLPAVQASREAARRAVCQSNLRQVGLALLGYETANSRLPVGAVRTKGFGHSWWVEVMPYLEQQDIYQRFDRRGADSGWAVLHGKNGALVDGLLISTMWCPSSPLEPLLRVGYVRVMAPSYVGIAGAASIDAFRETRVNVCCSPKSDGEISAGGVLLPNASVRLKEITDGTSQTLVAGEMSDYAFQNGLAYRIDGGNRNGWIMGTSGVGTPPNFTSSVPAWNLTSTKYPPNTRDYTLPGIETDHGANNPLVSAHAGGVSALTMDASVRLLTDTIDLQLYASLSTRDDQQAAARAD